MSKCIVVCGTSRGIGKAILSCLSNDPQLHVVALSRNVTELSEIYKGNQQVTVLPFDLSLAVDAQLKKHFAGITEVHGLINNAGYLEQGAAETLSIEAYHRCMQTNFFGPVALIQWLFPRLNAGKAHVVNISTMGAFQGSVKFPGLSAYAASKAAITNFTEVFAEEQKDSGIRMNCLCLGAVNTEMLRDAFPGYVAPVSAEEMGAYIADFTLRSGLVFNGKILPVSSSTP
jgi:NAD(P)-dependent dehydrogenase (short-subunit alcohol dehydrogenase family)